MGKENVKACGELTRKMRIAIDNYDYNNIETLIKEYEEAARACVDEPEFRAIKLLFCSDAGKYYLSVEKTEEAMKTLTEGRDYVLSVLDDAAPSEYVREACVVLCNLAKVYLAKEDNENALLCYKKIKEIIRPFDKEDPDICFCEALADDGIAYYYISKDDLNSASLCIYNAHDLLFEIMKDEKYCNSYTICEYLNNLDLSAMRLYTLKNDKAAILPFYESSLEAVDAINRINPIEAKMQRANVYAGFGIYLGDDRIYKKAFEMFREISDEHPTLAYYRQMIPVMEKTIKEFF